MDFKKYSIIISIAICVLLVPFIWADSNGIWHLAEDIRPGVIGSDEDDPATAYTFTNPVIYRGQNLDDRYIQDLNGDNVEGLINFQNVTYKGEELDFRYLNKEGNETLIGNLVITGSITATEHLYNSDINLKNINPLENSLEKVKQLEGVNFNWKSNNKKDIGFIAQDVEKIFPELVVTNKETGIKSVKYGNIVPILVEAVKEQQKQIKKLELEVYKLKNEN